jgi:hypothetical protein
MLGGSYQKRKLVLSASMYRKYHTYCNELSRQTHLMLCPYAGVATHVDTILPSSDDQSCRPQTITDPFSTLQHSFV